MNDEQAADAAVGDEEEPEDTADAESPSEGLQDGDFVRLDYTARTVEDGRVIDTTDPEIAAEEGFDEEGREFEPRIVVLGAGHLFEAVESDIVGTEVGYENVVEIPAADAFGEVDDSEVRTISTDRIDDDDRYPGAQVQIDGEQGIVETIVGGRARVDFNHPLAGEDVEWDFEVVEEIEDTVEKATGLVSTYLDVELDMWIETEEVEETVVEDDADADVAEDSDTETGDEEPPEPETETQIVEEQVLYIESDPQLQMNQQWMMGKQQIAQELMDRLDLDRVVVQETFEGGPMGMPGMMGGMGGGGAEGLEEQLEDADVDADEILEELETEGGDPAGGDPAEVAADGEE